MCVYMCVYMCVCVCVCVCVYQRARERQDSDLEQINRSVICVCVYVCVCKSETSQEGFGSVTRLLGVCDMGQHTHTRDIYIYCV